jgi:hypothetical protein
MKLRKITEEQVYWALSHERRRTPGQPGTIWVHGQIDRERILKVCVTTDWSTITTVAWPGE